MDQEALKSLQAPLKAKYKDAPEAAMITLHAEGRLGENASCSVTTARAIVKAALHPATGGSGADICSGDMLLEALVACAGVTLGAVATALGLTIGDAQLQAEGDLDFRGTLGVDKATPVGFQNIRLSIHGADHLSEEQRSTLLKLTERYCVVYQTLKIPPKLSAGFA